MNRSINGKGIKRIYEKINYHLRLIGKSKINAVFNENGNDRISQIYVINLDRKPDRWLSMKKELKRIKYDNKQNLYDISRRFSAIDGRYYTYHKDNKFLKDYYHLSDQLKVEPNKNYKITTKKDDLLIRMTKQEIAVALSHIVVWKKNEKSEAEYVLILEDDIYFTKNFSNQIEKIWKSALKINFDILFLSFEYVKGVNIKKIKSINFLHKPYLGIWQASGYILSKKGVKRLLEELPVYGPVDLWFNLKFNVLNALMIDKPIIKQRNDIISTNSYSIMPIFTKLGLYDENTPLIIKTNKKLPFLLIYGNKDTGLSSLSEALSMIGYTCCSNLDKIPNLDFFNAYINVGKFDKSIINKAMHEHKHLKIICTSKNYFNKLESFGKDVMLLPNDYNDKWSILSKFLNLEYPPYDYPKLEDTHRMQYEIVENGSDFFERGRMKWDKLPWINPSKKCSGLKILENQNFDIKEHLILGGENKWDFSKMKSRNDTFPSNLSIFKEDNVLVKNHILQLNLKKETANVRNYTSAAITSTNQFLYGKFIAEIKPSGLEGIITGVFLHRNSPHQEIDIEFLGKNHYGFLTNIFYNPGIDGTKLEYGYRGTPIWIDLKFDVTKSFHKYEIEWTKYYITWKVDNRIVHKRNVWQPTPIPKLPMQFNINIWNTNSVELAGVLDQDKLPATTEVKSVIIFEYK